MNKIVQHLVSLLAAITVSGAESIQSQIYSAVNSVSVPAGGPNFVQSIPRGEISHTQGGTLAGGTVACDSTGKGITLVTRPTHPGRLFFNTGALRCNASVVASSVSPPAGPSGQARLLRLGRWQFQALLPGLHGASGTFQLSFRRSLHYQLQRTNEDSSASMGSQIIFVHQGATVWLTDTQVSLGGLSTSASTTDLFTTAKLPMTFGSYFDFEWRVQAGASAYRTASVNCTAVTELQSCKVFNSAGQQLTRFVDYDWIAILDPGDSTEFTTASIAPADLFGPDVDLHIQPNNNIQVEFSGVLQESTNLVNWTDVSPQPQWRHELTEGLGAGAKFFRSRLP